MNLSAQAKSRSSSYPTASSANSGVRKYDLFNGNGIKSFTGPADPERERKREERGVSEEGEIKT